MVIHASAFTQANGLAWNPPKHYSVLNVRYSQSTILTLRRQGYIIIVWRNNARSDFRNKIYKPLRLFANTMGLPRTVRPSALLCIRSGVILSKSGAPPKPQIRNGTLIPPPKGDGSSRAALIIFEQRGSGIRSRMPEPLCSNELLHIQGYKDSL